MSVQVERLRPGQGPRWRRIRLLALSDAPHAFGTTYAEAAEWTAVQWEAQVTQLATFIAVSEGRDVAVVRGATHRRSEVRELISMWVAPSARRQGIARRLIDSVAGWAIADGASTLVLDVVADNAPAVALYERTGFARFDGDTMGERAPGEIRLVRRLMTP